MASITKGHFNDALAFTDTIVGSSRANMVLVPGTKGNIHLVHHGFGSNTTERFNLFFFHGNLSDCAAVRTHDPKEGRCN